MKIGYSCWGFLGDGITDTPDGGRSHRLTLLKALIRKGVDIVMLQKNRDLIESGKNFQQKHLSFHQGFPDIDVLFLEYRWKIQGRNYGLDKKSPLYTPDLDRQNRLIEFYQTKNIPILFWDKDQKLSFKDQKKIKNSIIFEPSLRPSFQRKSLLFPINKRRNRFAMNKIKKYKKNKRNFNLVYIGNQYERDKSFEEFINKPVGILNTKTFIFGNWNKYPQKYADNLKKFPNVIFKNRLSFGGINRVYRKSFATVIIAPDRYYKSGHFTQRIFESLWNLCIPLVPKNYYGADKVIVEDFIVKSGKEVVDKINQLIKKPDGELRKIFYKQFEKLNLFSSEIQARIIINTIKKHSRFIEKNYNLLERYECELKYLKIFYQKRIPVPRIHRHNRRKKIIVMKKIDGKITEVLSDKEIRMCINMLCKIITAFGLNKSYGKESKRYILKVRSNILLWARINKYNVNYNKLNDALYQLKKCCYTSVFKDAKPSNWIFQKNKIFAIDFDYVKKSFFLSDVAQLLSYVLLNKKIDSWKYAKYFTGKLLPSLKNYDIFKVPFMVAIVNSNVASRAHNDNLEILIKNKFDVQNKKILEKLEII